MHGFDNSNYKVEQVFYPSKDGTKIPMFITMRKDFVPDSTSPCLLYGYGGFSISLTPYFSTVHTFFVQHFGIMAIANMRGGGEYGERWSNGGRLDKLQNCLTDFQCAAEYLIKEKYTQKEKLTIYGGSHGGMLVGACANQRPELYGAAVSAVGVMDMLKPHIRGIQMGPSGWPPQRQLPLVVAWRKGAPVHTPSLPLFWFMKVTLEHSLGN